MSPTPHDGDAWPAFFPSAADLPAKKGSPSVPVFDGAKHDYIYTTRDRTGYYKDDGPLPQPIGEPGKP